MIDELYTLIYRHKDLSLLPGTFRNRLLKRLNKRQARKLAKKFAKQAYEKSLKLCEQVIEANFN